MKPVVIINGSGGVGKDTFVDLCRKWVRCTHISSVDIVKEAAQTLGWTGDKDERSRKFLSDLKILSTKYNDSPYKYIMSCVEEFLWHSQFEILFVDIREPHEIERIKHSVQHVYTLLITNPRVEHIISNDGDAGVNDYNYDYVISNNGPIEKFANDAERFINWLAMKGDR